MGALQQQGRSRARGEHTHSTHCTRGEHKFLQQNLRESTFRERAPAQHPQHCPPRLGWTLHPPTPSPFPVLFLPELKNDSEASAGQPVWDTAAGEALHAVGSRLCHRKSGHTSASSQSKDHSGTLGYFPLTGLWEKPTKT